MTIDCVDSVGTTLSTVGMGSILFLKPEIEAFRDADADLVTAMTMNYAKEAIGITRAAQSVGMPVAISFTVETDGKLPIGQGLKEAIAQVDAVTGNAPAYFARDCAHPPTLQRF